MWNRGPKWKSDVCLMCFPGCPGLLPIRRALSPRNSWTFSFMLPYSWEMMFIDISLDCVVSQSPLVALSSGFRDTFPHVSLFTKCDDSAKTVPVLSCFWRTYFGPFRYVAASSFDRISPGSKHFVGSGCWPNCVSQCCVHRVSLTVSKHLDSCSPFHKAVVTSRAFPSHFVSWF